MTAEQHAKLMIGDLLFTVARLQAENDALRELPPVSPAPPDTAPEPRVNQEGERL